LLRGLLRVVGVAVVVGFVVVDDGDRRGRQHVVVLDV
jgi:hypothetical protein